MWILPVEDLHDKFIMEEFRCINTIPRDIKTIWARGKKVLIPPSYANAHLCLSEECVFFYKWSYDGDYPDVNSQSSYKWDEPKFDIKWPIQNPILSDRDHNSKYL